jgi:hyperosmotically inducible periplasmic protein
MNVKKSMVTGLLAGSLLFPALVASADSAADDRLEERVEKGLSKDDKVGHIDVDVADGVATLRGEVASVTERARVERLARTAGAKKIVNLVEIDADKAVARIKERAEAKKERIDERAERAKDNVDRQAETASKKAEDTLEKRPAAARETTGTTTGTTKDTTVRDTTVKTTDEPTPRKEVIDPLVTAKVKTRIIKDDLLEKSEINVDSDKDGLVTLRGTVPSEAAHARALELARSTEGVRQVVDKLTVKAPVTK